MQRDLDKMRRRPFFFPLVLPVLLFIALVAAAAWLFDARATTVVFVVRHAEVETQADADPDLSVDGRERAARLAKMLSQAQPVRGVDAIFASEYKRTQQTATPLSETVALPVNVVASASWSELPRRITREHRGEYVMVVGASNTVPELVEALRDRKSTRLNSSHGYTSYAVFCLKKKMTNCSRLWRRERRATLLICTSPFATTIAVMCLLSAFIPSPTSRMVSIPCCLRRKPRLRA